MESFIGYPDEGPTRITDFGIFNEKGQNGFYWKKGKEVNFFFKATNPVSDINLIVEELSLKGLAPTLITCKEDGYHINTYAAKQLPGIPITNWCSTLSRISGNLSRDIVDKTGKFNRKVKAENKDRSNETILRLHLPHEGTLVSGSIDNCSNFLMRYKNYDELFFVVVQSKDYKERKIDLSNSEARSFISKFIKFNNEGQDFHCIITTWHPLVYGFSASVNVFGRLSLDLKHGSPGDMIAGLQNPDFRLTQSNRTVFDLRATDFELPVTGRIREITSMIIRYLITDKGERINDLNPHPIWAPIYYEGGIILDSKNKLTPIFWDASEQTSEGLYAL
ncbi:MAG: hypothetical protein WCO33_01985 [bacterium]